MQTEHRPAWWCNRRRRLYGRVRRRLCTPLACVALAACTAQPARLGLSPGDYEAFLREVMVEAAKSQDAAPGTATRAVRSAERWLGKGERKSGEGG